MSNIPTLKGYVSGGQIHVWCPFCCRWHHHGTGNSATIHKGHRVAHCYSEDSPFIQTGYYLESFSLDELESIAEPIKEDD